MQTLVEFKIYQKDKISSLAFPVTKEEEEEVYVSSLMFFIDKRLLSH